MLPDKVPTRGKNNINIWLPIIISELDLMLPLLIVINHPHSNIISKNKWYHSSLILITFKSDLNRICQAG